MKRRKFLKNVALTGATGLILPGINLFGAVTTGKRLNFSAAMADSYERALGMRQNLQSNVRKYPLDGIQRQNIKITDIKVRLFSVPIPPEKWWYGCGVEILTEIYTDKGIIGIGGPSPYSYLEEVKKYTEQTIRPVLIGQNPFDVDLITSGGPKFNMPNILNRTFTESCAWAGVNIACWDIIGKAVGQPVWKLLAIDHKPNPHIEYYASAGDEYDWSKRPEDLVDEAIRYKEEGFKSFKFRLGYNFDKVMTIKTYTPFLRKLRETVGPEFGLMQEGNMSIPFEQCLELVPVLDELNFVWLEEPISRYVSNADKNKSPEDMKVGIEGYLKIKKVTKKLLISGGETMQNREEFREWIDRGAYDIVQPDCGITGLTEGWNIARMANIKNKPCVPHNWHSSLTGMTSIQLVAGIPNQLVLESNRHYDPFREGLFTEPIIVKNSFADASSKPGLGVEIVSDADRIFPYNPKNSWKNIKH